MPSWEQEYGVDPDYFDADELGLDPEEECEDEEEDEEEEEL